MPDKTLCAPSETPASVLMRLDFVLDNAQVPLALAFLTEAVPYGWEEEEGPEATRFRVHMEDGPVFKGLVADLRGRWPGVDLAIETTPNREWALAWREFFTPVPCGEDFLVLAPWMTPEPGFEDRIAIVIEPKTAFGTGHHATTALCLTVLSGLHRAGRLASCRSFLDLGTGSGILGMACAKLGMRGLGLDIDPLAVENAVENKVLNGVAEEFALAVGGMESLAPLTAERAEPSFDLILANILAEPLKDLAPAIVGRLRPGACLVLSGILTRQAQSVAEAYTALGLAAPRFVESGEWSALVFA